MGMGGMVQNLVNNTTLVAWHFVHTGQKELIKV